MKREYRLLQYDSAPELCAKVNTFLDKGWEPLGGVSVFMIDADGRSHWIMRYTQAIIYPAVDLPHQFNKALSEAADRLMKK